MFIDIVPCHTAIIIIIIIIIIDIPVADPGVAGGGKGRQTCANGEHEPIMGSGGIDVTCCSVHFAPEM